MKIEKIFREISGFENITLDTVLFESKYPVLFTCRNGEDVYLFICCLVSADIVKWIATKTDYSMLVGLLENKITIRSAFLGITQEKIIIEYNGQDVCCSVVNSMDIQNNLLPADGEYMDAEDDEYEEEIAVFKMRNANVEYTIQPQIHDLLLLECMRQKITLPEECFNLDFNTEDETEYTVRKIREQRIAFA